MSTVAAKTGYSIDDYLTNEDAADLRHEYVGGDIFAMAGGSERHNEISVNVLMHLRRDLKPHGCRVFIADMKLRIDALNAIYYPDVMASCAEADDHPHYKTAPCILVEVLSPSTASIDRREKRAAYLSLPSLQAYVMADSETRSVEYLLRRPDGVFESGRLAENRQLVMPCGGHTVGLMLDDIYEGVEGLAHAA